MKGQRESQADSITRLYVSKSWVSVSSKQQIPKTEISASYGIASHLSPLSENEELAEESRQKDRVKAGVTERIPYSTENWVVWR